MSSRATFVLLAAALLAAAAPANAARRMAEAAAPVVQPADGSTPLALFGSGLLIEYYAGVAEVLANASVLTPTTPLAGNSGGAMASVGIALGLTKGDFLDMFTKFEETGSFEEALASILTPDVAQTISGRVRIGFSQLDAAQPSFNASAAWVVDQYTDKNDVLSALIGTACLPCFLVNTTFCTFRDQPVLDGGYAVSFEQLCPDGDTGNCIKVAADTTTAMHLGLLSDAGCEDLYPSRTDVVTEEYQNNANAAAWEVAELEDRCPASAWQGQAPYPIPAQVQAWWPETPDIFPGKYGPLPSLNGTQVTACEWTSWTRALPKGLELEAAEMIYAQGAADAMAWLEERAQA